MTPVLFTLDDANRTIPELERLFARLEEKREAYARQHDLLFMNELLTQAEKQFNASLSHNQNVDNEFQDLEKAILDLEEDVKAIRKLGCIVRSLEIGTVDFPARRDNQKIFYCWKKGEKKISYFRTPETAWESRQPLS